MSYKSNTRLAILLATYNSSKYIREQLDSLYTQSCMDWTLFVRDDGSKDDTQAILTQYNAKYGNIIIVDNAEIGLGAKGNFMALLDCIKADYYMFCDHDDVWLPHKVETTLNTLKKAETENPGKAVVLHTDLSIVDEHLNVMDNSMWHYAKIKPELIKQKKYSFACAYMTGCTMGFNNKAKIELASNMPVNALMHDWWIAIQAIFQNAVIVTIDKPTILYRIHANQEASVPNAHGSYFLKKLGELGKVFKEHRKLFPFMRLVGYGSVAKFYLYKILYSIKRNF